MEPQKIYDEKLEKEVSNIIGRNCIKITDGDGLVSYFIQDVSVLTIELMEYIIEKQYGNKKIG